MVLLEWLSTLLFFLCFVLCMLLCYLNSGIKGLAMADIVVANKSIAIGDFIQFAITPRRWQFLILREKYTRKCAARMWNLNFESYERLRARHPPCNCTRKNADNRFTVPRNSDDDALSFSGRLRTNLDTQWQKISNSNQCFESSTLVSVKFASANPSIKNNATK